MEIVRQAKTPDVHFGSAKQIIYDAENSCFYSLGESDGVVYCLPATNFGEDKQKILESDVSNPVNAIALCNEKNTLLIAVKNQLWSVTNFLSSNYSSEYLYEQVDEIKGIVFDQQTNNVIVYSENQATLLDSSSAKNQTIYSDEYNVLWSGVGPLCSTIVLYISVPGLLYVDSVSGQFKSFESIKEETPNPCFTPSSDLLIVDMENAGAIKIRDIQNNTKSSILLSHTSQISLIAVTSSSNIISADKEGKIIITKYDKNLINFDKENSPPMYIAGEIAINYGKYNLTLLSFGGGAIVAAEEDGKELLWDSVIEDEIPQEVSNYIENNEEKQTMTIGRKTNSQRVTKKEKSKPIWILSDAAFNENDVNILWQDKNDKSLESVDAPTTSSITSINIDNEASKEPKPAEKQANTPSKPFCESDQHKTQNIYVEKANKMVQTNNTSLNSNNSTQSKSESLLDNNSKHYDPLLTNSSNILNQTTFVDTSNNPNLAHQKENHYQENTQTIKFTSKIPQPNRLILHVTSSNRKIILPEPGTYIIKGGFFFYVEKVTNDGVTLIPESGSKRFRRNDIKPVREEKREVFGKEYHYSEYYSMPVQTQTNMVPQRCGYTFGMRPEIRLGDIVKFTPFPNSNDEPYEGCFLHSISVKNITSTAQTFILDLENKKHNYSKYYNYLILRNTNPITDVYGNKLTRGDYIDVLTGPQQGYKNLEILTTYKHHCLVFLKQYFYWLHEGDVIESNAYAQDELAGKQVFLITHHETSKKPYTILYVTKEGNIAIQSEDMRVSFIQFCDYGMRWTFKPPSIQQTTKTDRVATKNNSIPTSSVKNSAQSHSQSSANVKSNITALPQKQSSVASKPSKVSKTKKKNQNKKVAHSKRSRSEDSYSDDDYVDSRRHHHRHRRREEDRIHRRDEREYIHRRHERDYERESRRREKEAREERHHSDEYSRRRERDRDKDKKIEPSKRISDKTNKVVHDFTLPKAKQAEYKEADFTSDKQEVAPGTVVNKELFPEGISDIIAFIPCKGLECVISKVAGPTITYQLRKNGNIQGMSKTINYTEVKPLRPDIGQEGKTVNKGKLFTGTVQKDSREGFVKLIPALKMISPISVPLTQVYLSNTYEDDDDSSC